MKLNIGLIDVDDHHDKKKWGSTACPNLSVR